MSFSISITGHSPGPHNQAVQNAVEAALNELATVEGLNATVSGYSNDGESITLTGSVPRPVQAQEDDGA